MKAITLSVDRNRPFLLNMYQSYLEFLPDAKLDFLFPWQSLEPPEGLPQLLGRRLDESFKASVLGLLDGIPDEEWVYWATDDRYLVAADAGIFRAVQDGVAAGDFDDFESVMLDNPSRLRGKVIPDQMTVGSGDLQISFDIRMDLLKIWQHQFVRTGLLRAIFHAMPDEMGQAKEMDQVVRSFEKTRDFHRAQPAISHLKFAESMSRGIPTKDAMQAISRRNIYFPPSRRWQWKPRHLFQFIMRHKQIPWFLLKRPKNN